LAEVLITLLIIGVIAAIVIPSLIADTQHSEQFVQFKKTYSTFTQALNSLKAENGGDVSYLFSFNKPVAGVFNKTDGFGSKLGLLKDCGTSSGCWYTDPIKALNPSSSPTGYKFNTSPSFPTAYAILNDGALIAVDSLSYSQTYAQECASGIRRCGMVYFDINGLKSPNQFGRDVFVFDIWKDRLIAQPNGGAPKYDCDPSSSIGYGMACALRVLTENGINY
jgi:type II secretory pathway pseudopilin PulG